MSDATEITPARSAKEEKRDPSGRWLPGTRGGPGNPHVRKIARLRSALLKAVSVDDMRQVVAAMVNEAKAGNVAAAHFLADRIFGRPKQGLELTGPDGQPLGAAPSGERIVDLESCLTVFESFTRGGNGAVRTLPLPTEIPHE